MKNFVRTVFVILPLVLPSAALGHGEGLRTLQQVIPGGPADAAGLRKGDLLLRIAGREIVTAADLGEAVAGRRPGEVVPVTVERGQETAVFEVTLGERPGGGVLLGISVAVEGAEHAPGSDDPAPAEPTMKGEDCQGWVDTTYQLAATGERLGMDVTERSRELVSCIAADIERMPETIPVGWCDNVFKVHCSGLDLLTELGEAMIESCDQELGTSLGLTPGRYEAWRRCAADRIFDGYSTDGLAGLEGGCRETFLEGCAVRLDAVPAEKRTEDQRAFAACCAADSLESCPMIEPAFARGPCLDHPVCVNTQTSEWLSCS